MQRARYQLGLAQARGTHGDRRVPKAPGPAALTVPTGTGGITPAWDAGWQSCCAQSCLLRKTRRIPCEVKQLELKWRTGVGLNFRQYHMFENEDF